MRLLPRSRFLRVRLRWAAARLRRAGVPLPRRLAGPVLARLRPALRLAARALMYGMPALVVLIALGCALYPHWLRAYGDGWTHAPGDAPWVLSQRAQRLVTQSFADAHGRAVRDWGVAVISRGQLSGPHFVNDSHERGHAVPALGVWLDRRLRDAAAGMHDDKHADAEYVARLLRQIRAMPGAYQAAISARDSVFNDKGQPVRDSAEPLVANAYVLWLASRAPKRLLPVASVHPQRPDAGSALARVAGAGATALRWWPFAQRIDLKSAAARNLYPLMAKHHLRLIVTVGAARRADGRRGWVAPAAVKPALKAGVAVQLVLGSDRGPDGQRLMPALFRLLRSEAEQKNVQLTVSLAGVLEGARPKTELEPLLEHPQFFSLLRYGSDYPRVAEAGAVDLSALAGEGFIAPGAVAPLHAIYDVNPLLYAFVLMRRVHLPGTDLKLPAAVFFGSAADHKKQK